MSIFLKGAHLFAGDGKAKRGQELFADRSTNRTVAPRSKVPSALQLDQLVNYAPAGEGDKERWIPIGDDRLQALFAYSRVRGGIVTHVGPPVTGTRPERLISLGRKGRGRPAKAAKRCPHDKEKVCSACLSKSHGYVTVVAAKSQGDLTRRRVERLCARLTSLIGFVVSRDKTTVDVSALRTKAIESEDAVTLALSLRADPVMREAIAVATQGIGNLGPFRELSQAMYSLRHILDTRQFADFLLDGVATTRYSTVLNLPKGANAVTGPDAHRLSLCFAPMGDAATEPEDPIVLGLPAMCEVLRMLEVPAQRRRLFISFVYNGTGDPGITRSLQSFAPDTNSVPDRVTIRVGDDPLTWAQLCVLMRTFGTLIIEVSYFRPSEVVALIVAGIMLRTNPGNVCTDGMAVMHSGLRGLPREAHALSIFAIAQKHDRFSDVRRGSAMPSIIVTDDGTTNLSRVKRVLPLVQRIAAVLDPEAPPGPSLQPATAASGHTSE